MAAAGLRVHPWLSFAAAGFAFLLVMFVAGCESPDESATNVDPVRSDYFSYPRESRLPPCAPFLPEKRGNFIRWSRDGSSIVFQWADKLYRTAAAGSAVRLIDTEPTESWHAFDLSPDGRQIVYSACHSLDVDRVDRYVFRLARANINGMAPKILSRNHDSRGFPSWSPDGAWIVFRKGAPDLYVMAVNGSERREIATGGAVETAPPQWSPDSQRLAVTAFMPDQKRGTPVRRAVYTVGVDGSDPRELAAGVVSGPTWAPDGQRLAYARVYRDDVVLATIAADGTDERWVATIEDWGWAYARRTGRAADDPRDAWIRALAWSPDGAHLLYSCGPNLCVVKTDGRFVGRTPVTLLGDNMGAWSPDGTRIAVTGLELGDQALYTMTPDGGQVCFLVVARYVQATRNVGERLWRRIFGLEAEYPLVAVRDCEAAA